MPMARNRAIGIACPEDGNHLNQRDHRSSQNCAVWRGAGGQAPDAVELVVVEGPCERPLQLVERLHNEFPIDGDTPGIASKSDVSLRKRAPSILAVNIDVERQPLQDLTRRCIDPACAGGRAIPLAIESRCMNERIGRQRAFVPEVGFAAPHSAFASSSASWERFRLAATHRVSEKFICRTASQSALANIVPVRPMTSSESCPVDEKACQGRFAHHPFERELR